MPVSVSLEGFLIINVVIVYNTRMSGPFRLSFGCLLTNQMAITWYMYHDASENWLKIKIHSSSPSYRLTNIILPSCSACSQNSPKWNEITKFRTADSKPSEKIFLIENVKSDNSVCFKKRKQFPPRLKTAIDRKTLMVV